MAEPLIINTGDYLKQGKVEVDGNIWSVKLPGAATELKVSQLKRRLEFLEKKIDSGTATDVDIDKCDDLEAKLYAALMSMFSDGSEDNSSVVKWMEETPLVVILQVSDDIKEKSSGRRDQATSS